jgi:kumamolisin
LGSEYGRRSFPDVAFNADPQSGQSVYTTYQGQKGWLTIGGTSMAAPQWSGFMALVGEARANAKKSTLGFLNPVVYSLKTGDRGQLFNDVTSGSNGAYSSAAGWDAVTGWGSMKASALIKILSGI